jgi:hypothetical protein
MQHEFPKLVQCSIGTQPLLAGAIAGRTIALSIDALPEPHIKPLQRGAPQNGSMPHGIIEPLQRSDKIWPSRTGPKTCSLEKPSSKLLHSSRT